MRQFYALSLLLLLHIAINAQTTLSADGPGNTYELIESKGFGVENPDCVHGTFGPHVTEVFDNTLNKYVFVFHSHAEADNDRCTNFDRVRMEIKGGSGSPADMQHTSGQTAYYRWKFKLDAGFIPSSRFTHIFQIKAIDGDDGAPLITITPRAGTPQKMQIIHSAGEGSGSLGTVEEVDLAPFKGTWVEAYVKYKSSEGSAGTVEVVLKRLSDGATLLSYTNSSLDMWRTGASYNRGKWGVYRGKDAVLRDEQVRFADFCVTETGASLCPSDVGSNQSPTVSVTAPANNASFTAPANVTINATAADADGIVSLVEFYNGSTKIGEDATSPYSFTWTGVAAGSYVLTAKATDNNNAATTSATVGITVTVPPTCPAVIASADDGNVPANVLDNNLATRWSASGDGQWIQFCLSSPATVTGVQIAFYNGNARSSTFDVLTGNDGNTWTTAAAGRVSSGTSLNLETFTFPAQSAKYVRIVGHGNSVNLWNSYTEVKIQTGSGGGQTLTLAPTHDAYVRNGTNADVTHGTTDAAILITKLNATASAGNDRHTYLRFDASTAGASISSAVLRLYGKIDDDRASNIPVSVQAVSNTSWTESAITWNNKPATGASLQTATVTDATARYYTWNITAYVQSELAAGRTQISLALLSGLATDPRITWNSKETGSNAPELVITTASSLLAEQTRSLTAGNEVTNTKMLQVYPNPFRSVNTVSINLEKEGHTQVAAYDLTGRLVATLVNGRLSAGLHRLHFDASGIPAGLYILRLTANGKTITQKLIKE
ncbi:DNRLRE domain-containing protein [Paraflavitalea sp. CAU 1676]|uniref:CBM96 family carbohydrate-binding protein n=1 Tax=Paraflavitalea sp. CAU 1676 TaxID=3032598 RepID=UPI0023DA8B56|nr:DNRLRE domain-containing protein [Paraflavitalea sp. CAU 1676]MDF2188175.1 DNRLRE domain-containing protein [Paraflavitalea sp. CAU 1676]